ncbi:MAG: GIY-YIG nuclease family protein [Gammaproteobacteria bacterium]|nr:GIY-YIG nuclease family protein [Gammaproteobacteria bacterium]
MTTRGGQAPGSAPGTYLLRFDLPEPVTLDVGALGKAVLGPGSHYYAGSAFGPGGVAARVLRHVNGSERRHWHVDALRATVPVMEVWYGHAQERLEHAWAGALLGSPGARLDVAGFGASDCACQGHLVHFMQPLTQCTMERLLGKNMVFRWTP